MLCGTTNQQQSRISAKPAGYEAPNTIHRMLELNGGMKGNADLSAMNKIRWRPISSLLMRCQKTGTPPT